MSDEGPGLVVHRHTALMICEDAATLEELLQTLDLGALSAQRLGARALIVPAPQLPVLRAALEAQGVYPKTVGRLAASDAPGED